MAEEKKTPETDWDNLPQTDWSWIGDRRYIVEPLGPKTFEETGCIGLDQYGRPTKPEEFGDFTEEEKEKLTALLEPDYWEELQRRKKSSGRPKETE